MSSEEGAQAVEGKLEQAKSMKAKIAKIKGLAGLGDAANAGSESDGSPDEEGANTVEEFEGWTLEDHHNEMLALQNEFERLAKRHYDDTCLRIEEQIRSVNSGSDPEFKKNLQAVDRKYKSTVSSLEARKKMELATVEASYDGEMYALDLTFKEDHSWLKEMLVDQIKRKRLRALEPEAPEPVEEPIYGLERYDDMSNGETENEEFDHMNPYEDIVPKARRHAKTKPMPHSPLPMHTTRPFKRIKAVETSEVPVIYMLDQKEIEQDLAMVRM